MEKTLTSPIRSPIDTHGKASVGHILLEIETESGWLALTYWGREGHQ